jgi:hypothetical protein
MAEMGTEPVVEPVVTGTPALEAPVVPPVETPPARPDYLDPRFKTVEDQAKAYREAETKMQHEAQRRASLERELQMRQQPAPQQPQVEPQQENLDEAFWQRPTEVIRKLVGTQLQEVTRQFEPIIEDRFQAQKQQYANDPMFKELEPQIDQVFRLQPQLKQQPGAMAYVYNFMKAQSFDPAAERERLKAEVRAELTGANRQAGQIEGGGSPGPGPTTTPKMELTGEEQRTAQRFYSDLTPQEAYKRYFDSKQKWAKGGA